MTKLECLAMEHDIKAKLAIGAELSQREESYYLLIMASHSERFKYVKRKKALHCNGKPKM